MSAERDPAAEARDLLELLDALALVARLLARFNPDGESEALIGAMRMSAHMIEEALIEDRARNAP